MNKSITKDEKKIRIAVKLKQVKEMLPTDEEIAELAGISRRELTRQVEGATK